MNELIPRLLAGFLPVLLFLGVLMYLDSYKLVRLRWVIFTIGLGGVAAAVSFTLNGLLLTRLAMDFTAYSRYVAPVIEESAKAAILFWLIRSQRTGFLVDASIYGFAVGAGFALVENGYYLRTLPETRLVLWLIRGLGTAVMHGGTTSIFGMGSQLLAEFKSARKIIIFLPGLAMAIVLHSLYNHLFFSPVFSTIVTLAVFPLLIFVVFEKSEGSLEKWLEVGFDADTELLELMNTGKLSTSKAGKYLSALREKFSGEVVVDILCYLRIHLELSLRAKGILMMREAGFDAEPGEDTGPMFQEMKYLEKSIGKTGKLALSPFLHMSGKELWQLHMMGK
jgi:RsiW-degrading membrane proteinase PrsW (M82 family)